MAKMTGRRYGRILHFLKNEANAMRHKLLQVNVFFIKVLKALGQNNYKNINLCGQNYQDIDKNSQKFLICGVSLFCRSLQVTVVLTINNQQVYNSVLVEYFPPTLLTIIIIGSPVSCSRPLCIVIKWGPGNTLDRQVTCWCALTTWELTGHLCRAQGTKCWYDLPFINVTLQVALKLNSLATLYIFLW